jgi:hypothetical protein
MASKQDVPARVVRIKDEMETRHGVELKCETVDTLPELKQGQESCATVSSTLYLTCFMYQIDCTYFSPTSDLSSIGTSLKI